MSNFQAPGPWTTTGIPCPDCPDATLETTTGWAIVESAADWSKSYGPMRTMSGWNDKVGRRDTADRFVASITMVRCPACGAFGANKPTLVNVASATYGYTLEKLESRLASDFR